MRWLPLPVLFLFACGDPTAVSSRDRSVHVVFVSQASGLPPSYATILDSLLLKVTPAASPSIELGAHLGPRDTSVSFPMTVPEGDVRFVTRVLSNNQTLLYVDTTTQRVDRDRATVMLQPRVIAPVLVIAPETLRFGTTRALDSSHVTLYNRGALAVNVFVVDTSALRTACAPAPCYTYSAKGTTVRSGDSALVHIDSIRRSGRAIPLSFQTSAGTATMYIFKP